MSMLTEISLANAIDVLMRISFVLTAGLVLAYMARRNAALRHAILVAGLAASFIMPVVMLTVQVLPVSRWQLGLLGRVGFDNSAAVAVVSSRPPDEPQRRSAGRDHLAPEIVPTRKVEARPDQGYDPSLPSEDASLGPLARNGSHVTYKSLMASGLLSALLLGTIVKVIGLGLSLVRLDGSWRGARPVADDRVLSMHGLIQRRVPMQHPPRVLESEEVSSPIAAGIVGNDVLLPAGWTGGLCQDKLLAVLCHGSHTSRNVTIAW